MFWLYQRHLVSRCVYSTLELPCRNDKVHLLPTFHRNSRCGRHFENKSRWVSSWDFLHFVASSLSLPLHQQLKLLKTKTSIFKWDGTCWLRTRMALIPFRVIRHVSSRERKRRDEIFEWKQRRCTWSSFRVANWQKRGRKWKKNPPSADGLLFCLAIHSACPPHLWPDTHSQRLRARIPESAS